MYLAMVSALSTAALTASGESHRCSRCLCGRQRKRSTLSPLSTLCSSVSSSPNRTVTLSPFPASPRLWPDRHHRGGHGPAQRARHHGEHRTGGKDMAAAGKDGRQGNGWEVPRELRARIGMDGEAQNAVVAGLRRGHSPNAQPPSPRRCAAREELRPLLNITEWRDAAKSWHARPRIHVRSSTNRRRRSSEKNMHALQELGETLTTLSRDHLDQLDLPKPCATRSTSWNAWAKHEARQRHMQFIGKLMRDVDRSRSAPRLIAGNRHPGQQDRVQGQRALARAADRRTRCAERVPHGPARVDREGWQP